MWPVHYKKNLWVEEEREYFSLVITEKKTWQQTNINKTRHDFARISAFELHTIQWNHMQIAVVLEMLEIYF